MRMTAESQPLHRPYSWGPCDCCTPTVSVVCDHCLDLSGDHTVCAWPCRTIAAGWRPHLPGESWRCAVCGQWERVGVVCCCYGPALDEHGPHEA